jgi:rare lipoprotein A
LRRKTFVSKNFLIPKQLLAEIFMFEFRPKFQPSVSSIATRAPRIALAFSILLLPLIGATRSGAAESGMASVYAYSATATSSGEHASPGALTAAHRTLPFGTMVRVTNDRNGRSVVVRINDRGPFVRSRIIDMTPAGARVLGFSGLAHVTLSVIKTGTE